MIKKIPVFEVKPIFGPITERGQFVIGTKWKKVDKVQIGKRVFKKGQIVHWTNPDFGIDPTDAYEEYKFKINGFMLYDNEIDILPTNEMGFNYKTGKWEKTGLGRISLEDIHEFKRR